jgi:hypothetical protein
LSILFNVHCSFCSLSLFGRRRLMNQIEVSRKKLFRHCLLSIANTQQTVSVISSSEDTCSSFLAFNDSIRPDVSIMMRSSFLSSVTAVGWILIMHSFRAFSLKNPTLISKSNLGYRNVADQKKLMKVPSKPVTSLQASSG